MLVKIFGSAVFGVSAQIITIEVNVDIGVGYFLVGLPDNAIKESSYRISAALKNVGYKLPGKKITINMAPADLRKEGSSYDLPIAIKVREEGFKGFILSYQNAREAAIVNDLEVYGVENIKQVIDFFNGKENLEKTEVDTRGEFQLNQNLFDFDFSEVKG